MHVVFVTRGDNHKLNNNPLITQVTPEDYNIHTHLLKRGKSKIKEPISYSDWYLLGHDIETDSTDPLNGNLLLSAFCDEDEEVLVIDNKTVHNSEIFTPEILRRSFFIAHNADFEARWGLVNNFMPMRYGCTMVNDKRLLSGQRGYRFDIISTLNRRLGYRAIPSWMDKDVRNTFSNHDGNFTDDQILYNAADTIRLKPLYQAQLKQATAYNQLFLLGTINSRIIIPIAKAEIAGIRHDSEKWTQIAKDKETQAKEICENLDKLVTTKYNLIPGTINPKIEQERIKKEKAAVKIKTRQEKLEKALTLLEEKNKTHLKSYKTQKEQLDKVLSAISADATQSMGSAKEIIALINWGSQKQVLKVIEGIGCPMPISKDKKTHQLKAGVGKEARTNWFVQNEASEFMEFMKQFDKFKKLQHNIKSFGEKWIQQYVRKGRAFTSLDQAGTDTGRFSSGSKGKKYKEYANMQQIPAREGALYRDCFIADEGKSMMTLDYSNCEGVVMTSLARDMNMMKIIKLKDSHSYLGTKCWRNVYTDRYSKTAKEEWKVLAETYQMSKDTPEKNKERDTFKNSAGLFPVAYGVAAPKVAATSKVPNHEGQIMINTIKAEIPEVIKFLDDKSRVAIKEGYVIHNERTGSRRWFTPILDAIHYGFPLSKTDKIEAESASRNSPIQGTNSDLMKEAIAMIELYSNLFKVDVRMLLTVHDEWLGDAADEIVDWVGEKVKQLMIRAANNYLIPEISMDVDLRIAKFWKK